MAVTINGTTGITTTGDYDAEDGDKILLGTSDDLQIYHDGNDSFIKDAGTGGLYLCAHQFLLRNAAADEIQIQANENGAVELYYDNVKKMDTLTDGIGVLGVVYSQGLDVDDNHYIKHYAAI